MRSPSQPVSISHNLGTNNTYFCDREKCFQDMHTGFAVSGVFMPWH
jgi:hypothetical protein